MITSYGLEVRIWSLRHSNGKLTKEYVCNCIISELSRMFTGHQGQVQKLTNFLEVIAFALFFPFSVPLLHAVRRLPALLLC